VPTIYKKTYFLISKSARNICNPKNERNTMTKYFVTIIAVALFSSVAVADDFDNTALTLAVEGTDYGIELSANETSRSFELHTNDMPVAQYAVGMTDNESARDWSVSVTPSVSQDVRSFTLYVEPLFGLNWGDNHDKTQLELTPTIGASYHGRPEAIPYFEITGRNVAEAGDIFDIEASERIATLGAIVPVNPVVDVDLMMIQTMDKEWDNANRQIEAKLSIKF
jgi:hypothetical protein